MIVFSSVMVLAALLGECLLVQCVPWRVAPVLPRARAKRDVIVEVQS